MHDEARKGLVELVDDMRTDKNWHHSYLPLF